MASFNPQFAHNTLPKLAEAAYLQTINPATDLPAGYDLVDQIKADTAAVAQLMATAPAQHQQLLAELGCCMEALSAHPPVSTSITRFEKRLKVDLDLQRRPGAERAMLKIST